MRQNDAHRLLRRHPPSYGSGSREALPRRTKTGPTCRLAYFSSSDRWPKQNEACTNQQQKQHDGGQTTFPHKATISAARRKDRFHQPTPPWSPFSEPTRSSGCGRGEAGGGPGHCPRAGRSPLAREQSLCTEISSRVISCLPQRAHRRLPTSALPKISIYTVDAFTIHVLRENACAALVVESMAA